LDVRSWNIIGSPPALGREQFAAKPLGFTGTMRLT
jgi:hypothetical protein